VFGSLPVDPPMVAAAQQGILERRGPFSYRFVHDSIQEAALLLMDQPANLKATLGNIIVNELDEKAFEGYIFVAVNFLNEGRAPDDVESQAKLAEFNSQAAKKAMEKSAFVTASKYASKGIQLLPSNKWSKYYNITLELFSLAAELHCCLGLEDTIL
jgi:predicted ATPase